MLGVGTSSWQLRVGASSVGLRAIRAATAAYHVRTTGELTADDRETLAEVTSDLREEARIIRREEAPNLDDEPAFAFAGVTLHAIRQTPSYLTEKSDDPAATLDALASELDLLRSGRPLDEEQLAAIETIFTRTCELVQSHYGHSGELVDA